MKNIYTFCAALFLLFNQSLKAQALNGTYTIDPAVPESTTNFASFTSAVTALINNGVNGSVVFNVSNNTYNEQLIVPAITGTSATNTITFNGNAAVLTYNPTVTTERAVIKLNGADYFTFTNLTINATGTTTTEFGYCVQLMNGADNNTFRYCKINSSISTTMAIASNFAGIVINSVANAVITPGDANCHNNTISNNTIMGGFYGVAMVANGATATINNNKILNNIIQDFYNMGIYLNGNNNAVIEGNDISRPTRPLTPVYQFMGINLTSNNTNVVVAQNKIHDPFGANAAAGSGAFGFYLSSCSGSAGAENIFVNNAVYNLKSNGIVSGADLTTSNYNKFIHNTISLDDDASTSLSTTRGFSVVGNTTGLTIINNNVTISRGGTLGSKHCIYFTSTVTNNVVDRNNFFMNTTTGQTHAVGYFTGNRSTLADWNAASGFDVNSVSTDPVYSSIPTGDLLPTNTQLQNGFTVADTQVPTDIRGLGRSTSATLPTIGAYEINGTTLPVTASALKGVLNTNTALLSWSTFTETNNAGFELQRSNDTGLWQYAGFVATQATGGNSTNTIHYSFNDDIPVNGKTYYRFVQKDRDGKSTFSNIIWLLAIADKAGAITVYPNPAKNFITIKKVLAGTTVYNLIITDATGKTVQKNTLNNQQQTINIAGLANGIYFVKPVGTQAGKAVRFIKY